MHMPFSLVNPHMPVSPAGQSMPTGPRFLTPAQQMAAAQHRVRSAQGSRVALASGQVTASQWHALTAAQKASHVRHTLERSGYSSLNTANRGDIVYHVVDRINARLPR